MTRSAESFKDIATGFRNMVAEILASVYEKSFIDPMADAVGGWLTGWLFPSANGNAFSRGSLTAFANGGVVSSPTLFPMSGGNTGLMGEAGPEAIIPLSRTSSGRLGVEVAGGSGGTTVQVVQNFSFSANGDEAVKRIIQGEMPKIAAVTKRSVIDARSRGGQMKTVFGR
jgi:phage-related minor tail protein